MRRTTNPTAPSVPGSLQPAEAGLDSADLRGLSSAPAGALGIVVSN